MKNEISDFGIFDECLISFKCLSCGKYQSNIWLRQKSDHICDPKGYEAECLNEECNAKYSLILKKEEE